MKNLFANSYFRYGLVFVGAFLFFLFAVDPEKVLDRVVVYIFQIRDLQRSFDISRGAPIFWGPEMSGSGTLPGPFYYLLLLPSVLLSSSFYEAWHFSWWQMLFLGAGACGSLAVFFFARGRPLAAFLAAVMISTSLVTLHFLQIFLNPSFMLWFAVLALICIATAFSAEDEKTRGRAFVAGCFIVGLGLQLHFSIVSLFAALLVLRVFSARLRVKTVARKPFLRGIAAFLLPSAPFILWNLLQRMGFQIGDYNPYVGQPEAALPALARLATMVFSVPFGEFVGNGFYYLILIMPFSLPSLGLVWLANRRVFFIQGTPGDRRLARIFCVTSVCAFVPYSYIFFVSIANRYGMSLYLSLIALAALLQSQFLGARRMQIQFNILAGLTLAGIAAHFYFATGGIEMRSFAAYAVAAAVLGALAFGLRRKEGAFGVNRWIGVFLTVSLVFLQGAYIEKMVKMEKGGSFIKYRQWTRVWQRIYRLTGWSFEEARQRIYFVNTHANSDPYFGYVTAVKNLRRPVRKRPIDGFIIAIDSTDGEGFARWLLTQPVHDDLKQAIESRHIRFEPVKMGRLIVAPYFVSNTAFLPKHFHNAGVFYERTPYYNFLRKIEGDEAVRKLGENRYLFKWNECPGRHPYCNTGALVHWRKSGGDGLEIDVKVIGDSLSQISSWITPNWTHAWDHPFVELTCGDETRRFVLAESVGYKRRYQFLTDTSFFVGNNSIIAPFEKNFRWTCGSDLKRVAVGRTSSSVDLLTREISLPGRRLEVDLAPEI